MIRISRPALPDLFRHSIFQVKWVLNPRRIRALGLLLMVPSILGAIVLIGLSVGARPRLAAMGALLPTQSKQAAVPVPANLDARVIVLRQLGFEPSQITHTKGRFLLVVHNRSGLQDVQFSLAREAGPHVVDVRTPKEQPNWRSIIDLTPGNYILTDADHPEWICHITITPN